MDFLKREKGERNKANATAINHINIRFPINFSIARKNM